MISKDEYIKKLETELTTLRDGIKTAHSVVTSYREFIEMVADKSTDAPTRETAKLILGRTTVTDFLQGAR